jgi:hypothetical protein
MLLEKGCSDLFNNLSMLLADMFICSKILAQFGIGLVMMNSEQKMLADMSPYRAYLVVKLTI